MMGHLARMESQDLPVYPQKVGILLALLRPFHNLSLQHQEQNPPASLQTPSMLPAYLKRTKGHIIFTYKQKYWATKATEHTIFNAIFDGLNHTVC